MTTSRWRDGEHVRIQGESVRACDDDDADSYRAFHKRMTRFADLLRTYLNKTPPRLGTKDFKDLMTLGSWVSIFAARQNEMRSSCG